MAQPEAGDVLDPSMLDDPGRKRDDDERTRTLMLRRMLSALGLACAGPAAAQDAYVISADRSIE